MKIRKFLKNTKELVVLDILSLIKIQFTLQNSNFRNKITYLNMRMIGIKINLNFNRDKEFHNIEFHN